MIEMWLYQQIAFKNKQHYIQLCTVSIAIARVGGALALVVSTPSAQSEFHIRIAKVDIG